MTETRIPLNNANSSKPFQTCKALHLSCYPTLQLIQSTRRGSHGFKTLFKMLTRQFSHMISPSMFTLKHFTLKFSYNFTLMEWHVYRSTYAQFVCPLSISCAHYLREFGVNSRERINDFIFFRPSLCKLSWLLQFPVIYRISSRTRAWGLRSIQ
jgi:hypothetical protein